MVKENVLCAHAYKDSKALRSQLFSVKAISARLRKLMELTKQLIAIIIVNFVIAKINET